MKKQKLNNREGFVTLVSAILVGAVGVAIGTAVLLLGLGFSRTALVKVQSGQARALANACMEEGLQQIKDSIPYTGTGTLTLGQGGCTYEVTSQGAQDRTIQATGTVGTVIRKVTVVINKITPAIVVVSWQELP